LVNLNHNIQGWCQSFRDLEWGASLLEVLKELPVIFYRTLLLYGIALVVFRLMGKRSVANLAPFDLAVIIIIGEAAAIPMEDPKMSLLRGILPILILGALQIGLSYVNVFWRSVEKLSQGTSTLLVRNGKVLKKNLFKERVTTTDLIIFLREKGIDDINEVAECRLEPTGEISVIKRKDAQSLTPKDLKERTISDLDMIARQASLRLKENLEETLSRHSRQKASRGKTTFMEPGPEASIPERDRF